MNNGDINELLLRAEEKANANDLHSSSELYQRVTTLDPNNASAWYGYGVIQAKIGERNNAIEAFEKAIENKEIVPGGCIIGNDDPKWECNDCLHRWGTRDEDGDE